MAAQASLPALIRKKRDGERLEEEEIQSFVRGVTEGTAQQGQIGGRTAGRGVKDTKGTGTGALGVRRGLVAGGCGGGTAGGTVGAVVGNTAVAWPGQTRGGDIARGPGMGTR